ncbi:MAG: hypothetical protein KDC90_18490 [Ignavibacteriae bacterium]|nr:hypothetical protein [Ignavibacteriota bacterium]
MKFTKAKNPVFFILLAVVVSIWSLIIFKVINHFSNTDEQPVEIIQDTSLQSLSKKTSSNNLNVTIAYEKLERDPFVLNPIKVVKVETNLPPKPVEPKETLNFVVNGVLINNNSKTLVIVDQTDNQTVFLKEGMDYKSIKILSITPSDIIFIENGETKTIAVNN